MNDMIFFLNEVSSFLRFIDAILQNNIHDHMNPCFLTHMCINITVSCQNVKQVFSGPGTKVKMILFSLF